MTACKKCSVNACENPVDAKGLCHAHYMRMRRHGNPLVGRTYNGEPRIFFEMVVLTSKDDDCVFWKFSRNHQGYARMRNNDKTTSVSRLVCERIYGKPPTTKHEAAHTCGKGHKGCVNPRHLRWATPKENHADKRIHGTAAQGKKHGRAKLTEADVLTILQMPGTFSAIAAKFGVSGRTISKIKNGERWTHLSKKETS